MTKPLAETNRQLLEDIRQRQYVISAATLELISDNRMARRRHELLAHENERVRKDLERSMAHNGHLMAENRLLREKLIRNGVRL